MSDFRNQLLIPNAIRYVKLERYRVTPKQQSIFREVTPTNRKDECLVVVGLIDGDNLWHGFSKKVIAVERGGVTSKAQVEKSGVVYSAPELRGSRCA